MSHEDLEGRVEELERKIQNKMGITELAVVGVTGFITYSAIMYFFG